MHTLRWTRQWSEPTVASSQARVMTVTVHGGWVRLPPRTPAGDVGVGGGADDERGVGVGVAA